MRVGVLAMVLGLVSGCAVIPSRALRVDEEIVAGRAREGYVVIAASSAGMRPDTDLLGGYLCQDGDLSRCVGFGPQSTNDGYRAYALPPGTWCVTQVWVQNGDFVLDVAVERANYQCFAVERDTVSYPGHVEVFMEDTQFAGSARTGFSFNGVAGAQQQAQAKYPALAAFPWATPVLVPPEDDRPASPFGRR